MNEWQLIETAPKDGSEILVACDDGEKHIVFWGRPYEGFRRIKSYHWVCVGSLDYESGNNTVVEPIYWLPIPELPERHD